VTGEPAPAPAEAGDLGAQVPPGPLSIDFEEAA
jgi:hypothetical protein